MSEKGKEAGIAVTAEELARINRFAKKELRAEEVYTFAVKLCDNEVDRDFERFDRAALEKLSELFVGRTGIFDHSWSAGGQTARIYRAEVIEEETRTTAGDKYCWCKGWAYMLRTEKNAELIAEIEGGIKKEVSVGCSAAKRSCSICGKDAGLCEHERGKYYGGKLCYAVLSDITDAYEWRCRYRKNRRGRCRPFFRGGLESRFFRLSSRGLSYIERGFPCFSRSLRP